MTLRAKPVVKRSRSPWRSEERRNFYMNLGFAIVVIAAIGILVAGLGFSWYDQHFGEVASVDGRTITKDQFRDRLLVESFRLDVQESRVSTERSAGRWTDAQAQTQLDALTSQRQALASTVLQQLIDGSIQEQLATEEGVVVGDELIDARLTEEATTPAQRHVRIIEIRPEADPDAVDPTPAQVAAAKKEATDLLAEANGGGDFAELAMASSDGTTAPQGGDVGWIQADDVSLEPAFVEALFATQVGGTTDVIEGDDGVFRFGQVTEEVAAETDPTYTDRITDSGIALETYRNAVRTDVTRTALEDQLVGSLLVEAPQRRVSEIFMSSQEAPPQTGAVKVRHVEYAPNGDPTGAAELPEDDPAWDEAKKQADATYAILKDDIDQFDAIARRDNPDNPSGGKLPYFDPGVALDEGLQPFADAIFADGVEDGDLLAPVRTSRGWHVIQVMYHAPDQAQMDKLKAEIDGGADFGPIARDFSEAESAADMGELGWVARGQLDPTLEGAIFATNVGQTTDVISTTQGLYLFLIEEEQTRAPDEAQAETIRSTYFNRWYAEKKADVDVQTNADFLGTTTGA